MNKSTIINLIMVFVVIAMFFAFLYYHFVRETETTDVSVVSVNGTPGTNKILSILASLEKVKIDTSLFVNPKKEGYLLRLSDFKKFDPKPAKKSPNKQNIFVEGPGPGYRSLDPIQMPVDTRPGNVTQSTTSGPSASDSENKDTPVTTDSPEVEIPSINEEDNQGDTGEKPKVKQTVL
jgi:hypothetical protein